MQEAYRLGGWGMYPTTLFGLVLVVMAIQYARDPDRRRLALVKNLSLLTMLSAALGFISGLIRTFTAAGELSSSELGNVVVIGVGESLTNVGLGVGFLVMTWILASVGAARSTPTATREDLHAP
jgi:hypothetical protein